MGDNLRFGSGAQNSRRALRSAQGPRACGPHADYGDEGLRGKGKVLGCSGPWGTGLGTALESCEPSLCVPAWPSRSSDTKAGASL